MLQAQTPLPLCRPPQRELRGLAAAKARYWVSWQQQATESSRRRHSCPLTSLLLCGISPGRLGCHCRQIRLHCRCRRRLHRCRPHPRPCRSELTMPLAAADSGCCACDMRPALGRRPACCCESGESADCRGDESDDRRGCAFAKRLNSDGVRGTWPACWTTRVSRCQLTIAGSGMGRDSGRTCFRIEQERTKTDRIGAAPRR